ncbi:CGGC domain-containing protein [Desulfotruncus alcoholivorax]|uniref:CGGC domain-containing protein n=1 Tax=Desulfotruncus alcoholivorax TaxID=265477 RepID=UPI00041F4408|nr:CGGC domain-containing protein [Desulfotruncus alcoholivorax]
MKVLIVACGNYASQGYGCPGEWKCLTAAAKKEGEFAQYEDNVQVIGFLECECNGRQLIANIGCVKKNSDFDAIHFSTCMAKPWPNCPYMDIDELAGKVEEKFGVKVIKGTHNYG